MVVLGLTGSIGMGKSATAQMFRDAGVAVYDADAVVHALYKGDAAPLIEARFPGTTRDGEVDREALGRQVVADPAALRALEAIVHPLVRHAQSRFLDEARARLDRVVVLDVPLLFETGGDRLIDATVVVSAPKAVQEARVLARPGMTKAKFEAMLAKQMPDEEKRRRARWVIDTGRGFEGARAQVRAVLTAVESSAAADHGTRWSQDAESKEEGAAS